MSRIRAILSFLKLQEFVLKKKHDKTLELNDMLGYFKTLLSSSNPALE